MNHPNTLRIIFAGTPDFSVPALDQLVLAGFRPIAVYTQPDRPAGRGRKLHASPVKSTAQRHGIPVYQPDSLKSEESRLQLGDLGPDLFIVVAYGLILPPDILEIPTFGCWNIHASLLPRWRGAAPVQRAIEAGDPRSGVCIMQMDEGLDTGDILACNSIELQPDETGGSLHDRLADLGADLLIDCVQQLANGNPPVASAQARDGMTYAQKLRKPEGRIDWQLDALTLERRIRAFNPWPVCWCILGGERVRIWTARASDESSSQPAGSIVPAAPGQLKVACGRGTLKIDELQRAGGRKVSAQEFLNAHATIQKFD